MSSGQRLRISSRKLGGNAEILGHRRKMVNRRTKIRHDSLIKRILTNTFGYTEVRLRCKIRSGEKQTVVVQHVQVSEGGPAVILRNSHKAMRAVA